MHIVLEPGDMTKYTFLIEPSPNKGYLFVSGSPRFDLYEYRYELVEEFYARRLGFEEDLTDLDFMDDNFVLYIVHHSNCNPWTARAAIIAMKRFADLEKNNYE